MAKKQTAPSGRSGSTSNRKSQTTTDTQKNTRASTAASKTTSAQRSTSKASSAKPGTTSKSRASKTSTTSKSRTTSKATKSKPSKRVTKRPEIARQPGLAQRLWVTIQAMFKTAKDPAFWQRMIQKLPPWTDEVGAILLIVAGVVMLTALLNTTSEAALSITLSRGLRQLFGYGAYLVAVTVLGVGVWILLPKFGIVLRVGWTKIIAAETMFGALAALLHLLANDPELHALAREGKGGGFLGWVLMQMPYTLAGPTVAIVLFAAIFAAGLIIVTGLRLYHLTLGMGWLRARLQDSISRLDSMSFEPEPDADDAYDHYDHEENPDANRPNPGVAAAVAHATSEADFTHTTVTPKSPTQKTNTPAKRNPTPATGPQPAPPKRPSKARSKSNPRSSGTDTAANTPKPTTPPPANPDNPTPKNGQAKSAVAPDPNIEAVAAPPVSVDDAPAKPVSKPKLKPLTKEEKEALVAETRRNLGAPNGRSLVAPGEPGERSSVVPRDLLPDARVVPAAPRARVRRDKAELQERYFTVDDFRESKKIGKRDKNLPVLDLLNEVELNKPTEEEINTNAKIIKNTLLEFDVETEVVDVKVGPTVTQYAVSPYTEQLNDEGEWVLNRVRVSEITRLGGDLALALSAKRLRIQAPVPGHSYVGIEVPNRQPSTVALRPVLESEHYYKYRERPLALPLGRDVSGEPFIADLGSMPHLLIAGTTGSGKSIMLAAMTTAFVANNTPDQVKLVLLDPKMVELSRFNGLPHLLGPVETELDRIIGVLRWATREMDRRYKLLEKEAARNLAAYNRGLGKRRKDDHLPFIVIIIDEIGDLMLMRPDETERALTRLAQMARAVGIHLMVATQRPSVDVITGLIKANFPARISFAVASSVDSRVILDSVGAETLMGRGDMLFLAPDAAGPQRVQGCYVSDEEVNAVVNYWRDWYDIEIEEGRLEEVRIGPWERGMTRREVLSETDPMLEEAITLVVAEGEASASLLQRRLGLGYPRAARLMDLLQELGIVGTSKAGGRSREVLVKPGADPFKKIIDKKIKNKK